MSKYKNKYRVESTRLKGWDYSSVGKYFITFVTKHRKHWFGKIENGEMKLNQYGKIFEKEILNTEKVRKNIKLDTWQIMPNHFHGIFIIENKSEENNERKESETLKPNSIGSIIGQIKSIVTKKIWETGEKEFAWQGRFHDRIIRDEKALNNIRRYIKNNPKKWNEDKFK